MKSLYILSDSTGVGQFVTIHKTWPVLLSQHLEGRYNVQNVSISGETSRQALERLVPDVLRYKPDLVYVQYGENDANHWKTDEGFPRLFPDEFKANMLSIIRRCVHFGSDVVLGAYHTGAYCKEIMDICSSAKYIVHHSNISKFDMLDNVHLNEHGHKIYFENIAKVIR